MAILETIRSPIWLIEKGSCLWQAWRKANPLRRFVNLHFRSVKCVTAMNIEIYHAPMAGSKTTRPFVPSCRCHQWRPSLLAGFTCSPLVRFPIQGVESGKKVRGTTIAELGNRNRPLDMIVYEKEGKSYVLMANSARGVMKVSS